MSAIRRRPDVVKPENIGLLWRCAAIAVIPVLAWTFSGPAPVTQWQRAGDLHYQVRHVPGTDEACLILDYRQITPGLEPLTCWD